MAVDAHNTPVPDSETSPYDAGLEICPFCGSDDLGEMCVASIAGDSPEICHVECMDCEASGPPSVGSNRHIIAWNTRTSKAVKP